MMTLVFVLLSFVCCVKSGHQSSTIAVPTSCKGLSDGEHIIKPLEGDEYALLSVNCRNGYMIVDIGHDAEWYNYFTSTQQFHYDIIGPSKGDMVNWNNWFIPSIHRKTKYLVSPRCNKCDINDEEYQQQRDETAWYMNAAGYGHFFGLRRPACDFNWDSLQCRTCEWGPNGDMLSFERPISFSFEDKIESKRTRIKQSGKVMIGVCLTEVRNAYQYVQQTWKDYNNFDVWNYKPSLGINGRFCQCIKTPEKHEKINVNKDEYDNKIKQMKEIKNIEKDKHNKNIEKDEIIYLYQTDFEDGTYRIEKSGTYMIMEDITFDFNAAPKHTKSPNDVLSGYWWPSSDLADKYPGAGYVGHGQYLLGYFAGITIETNHVTLDLNGYTLQQSRSFFYQQPFFAIINLYGQPFLPNQGPGFFGPDPHFAENVIIKNGIIGRSSHHGIQGTNNKNLKIQDIKITNFGTHGIQINGFDGVYLKNVDIGYNANDMYLNHNYAHLRMLLPYIDKMANWDHDHRKATISFDERIRKHDQHKYTLNDLIHRGIESLDKVYNFVMHNKEFNNLDTNLEKQQLLLSKAAEDDDFHIFINADGLPYGAVIYGISFSYMGSTIFGWDVSDSRNDNLYINNLDIHDLQHNGDEVIGLTKGGKRFVVNTLLAPLNLIHLLGSEDALKEWIYDGFVEPQPSEESDVRPIYVGNIVTDLFIAMAKFGTDKYDIWWLGTPWIGGMGGCLINWAEGQDDECLSSFHTIHEKSYWEPLGSVDGMVHSGKGTVGLKATNIDNIELSGNINIYNLFDYTATANEITKPVGDLKSFGKAGNTKFNDHSSNKAKLTTTQQWPYQLAYSMNQIYGFTMENSNVLIRDNTNINIANLKSLTGRVLGFTQWYATKIIFEGDNSILNIHHIAAGIDIKKGTFEYDEIPNHEPEVCLYAKFVGNKWNSVIGLIEFDGDDIKRDQE